MSKRKYGNKKVIVNGVKFDSDLERYCYDLLCKFKIPFKFQLEYELQPSFKNPSGKSIRRMYMKIDFVISVNDKILFVDTKGYPTEVSKIKYKMLDYQFSRRKKNHEVIWLKNKTEVKNFILNLYDGKMEKTRGKRNSNIPKQKKIQKKSS